MATRSVVPSLEHLSLVAYFERELDALPELVQTCRTIGRDVMGNVLVRCSLWEHGLSESERVQLAAHPMRDWAAVKFKARLAEQWDLAMLAAARKPHFVAASYPGNCNRYVEYGFKEELWALVFDAASVAEGQRVRPYLRMEFNLDRLDAEQQERLPDAVRCFGEAAAATGLLCSGFGDVADVMETACGVLYSGTDPGWVRVQRQLHRLLWIRAGDDRHHKARGVFWANLFGRVMVDKLGGTEVLVREYEAQEGMCKPGMCTVYPDGSVLLLLSPRVVEMRYPYRSLMPPTLTRAAWLYERLSHAGLMCGS